MSYRNLEIYQLARKNTIIIHEMSLKLPKFEMYETDSQIRRSSKSVRSNIVEGYGRRRYKNDYVRFLIFAQASNDETIDHLESLFETQSLKDEALFHNILQQANILGKKLNRFISSVDNSYQTRSQKPETS